ncbi:unnamed protein product, partial [Allacma fusca]
ALQAENREPTDEEHAVLAQWEQIYVNKQDDLKAAGIIDRRASVPVTRTERRKSFRKDAGLTLKKNNIREYIERRGKYRKRELSDEDKAILQKFKEIAVSEEDKAVIQKLEEIALTIDAEDRDPTPEELAVLGKAQQIAASESDNDIIKKSKEIKEALEVEHREPTAEEHAVLAQWEHIFANKQDELKAAGIIDRRASAPIYRYKRAKRLGKDVDRSEEDKAVIQKLEEIALTIDAEERDPNKQDELKAAGSIDRRALLSLIASSLKRRAPIRTDLDRNLREHSS